MIRKDKVIVGLILINVVVCGGYLLFQEVRKNDPEYDTTRLPIPAERIIGNVDELRGKKEATYTLIEFGDYQCPPCASQHPKIEELLKKHEGKLRFGFKHFPLPIHGNAVPAAELAERARVNGKFWEMHDHLFSLNARLNDEDLVKAAKKFQIKLGAKDGFSEMFNTRLLRDKMTAKEVDVKGTPTFILCKPDGTSLKIKSLDVCSKIIK